MKSSYKDPFMPVKSFLLLVIATFIFLFSGCAKEPSDYGVLEKVTTFAGLPKERGAVIGEPFGLAFDTKGNLFISDGEAGKIWQADAKGELKLVTDKLDTPSGLAFDKNGDLLVADPGSHTIKKVNVTSGDTSVVAGTENKFGFADGAAASALFNAPIGIAADDKGKIYVADTYNDRIRVIENGNVSTIAGGARGFADGGSAQAQFDTPCGITVTREGALLIADTGNGRVRSIEPNGNVSTLAGGGDGNSGLSSDAGLTAPMDIKVDTHNVIYISDAGARTIYALKKEAPSIDKLGTGKYGFNDGALGQAAFQRPTGLAIDTGGKLFVADSEEQVVRVLESNKSSLGTEVTKADRKRLQLTADDIRASVPPRWPYDPPERPREVAGTFGELRGSINDDESIWFHNGLDVAGGYGETARFMRSEKVLRPISTGLFETLRENVRLPIFGYIHLRLGRDQNNHPFGDPRFIFSFDAAGRMSGVRIRRGTKFAAGEPIGTLNSMNHVHLVVGRSGHEMNALSALTFPGMTDSIAPAIQEAHLFDENWKQLGETKKGESRINVSGKIRIVVRAYDRMDGNADRRRLGVYRLGYQVLREDGSVASGTTVPTIIFDVLPTSPRLVYAPGSKSGATGETIFNYIVTNNAQSNETKEEFLDVSQLGAGDYTIRVTATDYFNNEAAKEIKIHVAG
jgi:sugar lactone lactonase YvrE